LYDFRH